MVLITGAAGFIGFHLAQSLLDEGHEVIGLDNLNDYYDENLKIDRLDQLKSHKNASNFIFERADIKQNSQISAVFNKYDLDKVIHLAAQAGVRYSIEHPSSYIDSNLIGFFNILECCKESKIEHLVFASSSSIYGQNISTPFKEDDMCDSPISLYAATKKSNELMAHSYSHLYGIPITGLRFFTVYGPYGRPDMAYFKFTRKILNDEPINLYNNGNLLRDFTYIDDVVDAIKKSVNLIPPKESNASSSAVSKFRVFNVGNNNPVKLKEFVKEIEKACDKKAIINLVEMQQGDVNITFADIDKAKKIINFSPKTKLSTGIRKFVTWYKEYYPV